MDEFNNGIRNDDAASGQVNSGQPDAAVPDQINNGQQNAAASGQVNSGQPDAAASGRTGGSPTDTTGFILVDAPTGRIAGEKPVTAQETETAPAEETASEPSAQPASAAEGPAASGSPDGTAAAREKYPVPGNAGYDGTNMGQRQEGQRFYNENVKKTKTKKISTGQLILVALLSSVIGAGLMFAAVMFLAPVVRADIDRLLGISTATSSVATGSDNGAYKKVEITKSSSPVEAISEKVGPSIVGIKVTVKSQGSGFFFDFGQDGVGEGSGIIIREDGYILTNNHVIESALGENSNKINEGSKIEVVLPNETDKSYAATVVGRDSKTDIAVLKIEASNLHAAELGDSDKVKVGELAVAIGNPGGMDYMGSVTSGIISGINRTLKMDNGRELKLIQTDAAINPGNSGGALVDSEGKVIGVNTVKIAATGYEGLGFAIPINEANEIAKSLIDYKYVKGRPYLGVSIDQRFTPEYAEQYNVPKGLLVYEVVPLSAAYKAGIHANDIITKFDGKTVTVFDDLEEQKNKHKPGDSVKVEVYRDGKTLELTVVLDEEKNVD